MSDIIRTTEKVGVDEQSTRIYVLSDRYNNAASHIATLVDTLIEDAAKFEPPVILEYGEVGVAVLGGRTHRGIFAATVRLPEGTEVTPEYIPSRAVDTRFWLTSGAL